MKVREYNSEDYDLICGWWIEHDLNVIPDVFLPVGFIVEDEGGAAIAAAWIHCCKYSLMSWMNWPIVNPNATDKQKHKALTMLCDNLRQFALKDGYRFMGAFWHQKSLVKFSENYGFMKNHDNVTEMFIMTAPMQGEN